MKRLKIYLIVFLIAYAFAYYYFLRHLKIPSIIISSIPILVAIIMLSEDKKSKSKVLKKIALTKKNKQNDINND